MTTPRELPPQDQLLKSRDREPIIPVPPTWWNCLFCPQPGGEGAGTTVDWVGPSVGGADGRCRECGQKYCLMGGLGEPAAMNAFKEMLADRYPDAYEALQEERARGKD